MSQTQNHQTDKNEGSKLASDGRTNIHPSQERAHASGAKQLKREAKQASEEVREQADAAIEEAKQKGKEIASQAKNQAESFANEQQQAAAQQINGVAKALRTTADQLENEQAWLASGVGQAAKALENTAESLRDKDVNSLLGDLQTYARKQPAVVLGGAAVVGFLLSRFLKSSAQRQSDDYRSASQAGTDTVSAGPNSY